jgi:RNA polymerase sigma-70 factor (ECF subfamily)
MPGDVTPHDEFLALVEPLARSIRAVASAWGRTAEDRRDLEQEILAQLWRAFPRYDRARPFPTWLYRVALNVAISQARARWPQEDRRAPLEAAEDLALDARPRDERLAQLHTFISELEPLPRALVVLHLEDRPHREIAEILGLSETNVSTRLSRLRQRLRERFSADGGTHGAR